MSTHPEDIPVLNEAKYILLGGNVINELSPEEVSDLEHDIFDKCGLASC